MSNSGLPQLGVWALGALFLYLAAMLAIGWLARERAAGGSPLHFFLGGKTTGALVLFFTMQATQYSGNTFFGFTGMAYRNGLIWILSIPLVGLIITTQLSFAPRLYVLSKRRHYLTPADYYADRFDSRALRLIVAALTIVSMFPYLMIQAEATGHAVVGLSSGALPFWSGVVSISLVMAVYISVGGWRGVVWTDAVQGLLLTAAMLAATVVVLDFAGGLRHVIDTLDTVQPALLAAPADAQELSSRWLSLLLVSAIGFAMYPQAIQRIYAARTEKALRISFGAMLGVPFVLGSCTLLIGLCGATLHPGLRGAESDRIFALLLSDILARHHALVVFVLCGVLAAIMSTASSVVLTLSSIFTRDLYHALLRPQARNRELALVGRLFSWLVLMLVALASFSSTTTLWRLTEIKIELLMQLFPSLVLGLYWPRMGRLPAIAGILGGSSLALVMMLSGNARWGPFQAGFYGFLFNLAICVFGSLASRPGVEERQRVEQEFFSCFAPPRLSPADRRRTVSR